MKYVEDYFQILDLQTENKTKRRVYLATDEPSVFKEIKSKFPNYEFLNPAGYLNMNATDAIAKSIILDIHFLSQCEYLVCTFTSNVCRMAYELMQVRYVDASWRAVSLDDSFYTRSIRGNNAIAIHDHLPEADNTELQLKKGDILEYITYYHGNKYGFLNGYFYVFSLRLNRTGLVPSYKIKKVFDF
jgi:glycoprotein 6-alpha-L-fucosyltransferase